MNAPTRRDLKEWLAPHRTAFVVIDMQVDFASPDGALGRAGVDMSATQAALAAAQRLAEAARIAHVPVIFVGLATNTLTDSPAWSEWRKRLGGPERELELCRAGARGADFVGPAPQPGELVVWKLRYSGFFGTSLDAALRALEVDTLLVCGLTTECCVDCTVRDAFHLDYHVFVARDACAAYDSEVHESALKNLALNCAILVDSEDIVAGAWSQRARISGERT